MSNDRRKPFATNSFTEREVAWLKQVFTVMARGGDISILRRAPEYTSVFRKVVRMEKTIERKQLSLLQPAPSEPPEDQPN